MPSSSESIEDTRIFSLVVRQAGGHVREAQEHRVPDDVEQRAGHEAGPLPDHLAVLAPPAVASVLDGVVVGLADGDLLEAVPLLGYRGATVEEAATELEVAVPCLVLVNIDEPSARVGQLDAKNRVDRSYSCGDSCQPVRLQLHRQATQSLQPLPLVRAGRLDGLLELLGSLRGQWLVRPLPFRLPFSVSQTNHVVPPPPWESLDSLRCTAHFQICRAAT